MGRDSNLDLNTSEDLPESDVSTTGGAWVTWRRRSGMKALKPWRPPKNSSPLVLWYQAPKLNSLALRLRAPRPGCLEAVS